MDGKTAFRPRGRRMAARIKSPAYWGGLAWSVVRLVIVLGIGFMILYPILVKFVTCFMSINDLKDPTVKLIPKEGSLDLFWQAFGGMEYFRTLLTTAALTTGRTEEDIAAEIGNDGAGALKRYVTESVNAYLAPIRERRRELEGQPEMVREILHEGNRRANEIANATLDEVREAMGMVY